MMKGEVFNELRGVISETCNFKEQPNASVQHFHKEFLKRSLEALDVSIDYRKKAIVSWSAKPVEIDASTIYKLRDSVNPVICYDDLESTLLGCIRETAFFESQYKLLLDDYLSHSFNQDNNTFSSSNE